MRVSGAEKDKSRQRIVDAASRLFRKHGTTGASVNDIMTEAGMTHGGFYRHFPDKESLLAAGLADAFERFNALLDGVPAGGEPTLAEIFRTYYLSPEHHADPETGCPAAALGPDIARSSEKVRAAFSVGLENMVMRLAGGSAGDEGARRAALRALSMMVGAMVLSRAAEDGLGHEILEACAEPNS